MTIRSTFSAEAIVNWPIRVLVIATALSLIPSVPTFIILTLIAIASSGNAITEGQGSSYLVAYGMVLVFLFLPLVFTALNAWAILCAIYPKFTYETFPKRQLRIFFCVVPMYFAASANVWLVIAFKLFPYGFIVDTLRRHA